MRAAARGGGLRPTRSSASSCTGATSPINHKTLEIALPSPPQYGLRAPETLTVGRRPRALLPRDGGQPDRDRGAGRRAAVRQPRGSCTDRALRSTDSLDLYTRCTATFRGRRVCRRRVLRHRRPVPHDGPAAWAATVRPLPRTALQRSTGARCACGCRRCPDTPRRPRDDLDLLNVRAPWDQLPPPPRASPWPRGSWS